MSSPSVAVTASTKTSAGPKPIPITAAYFISFVGLGMAGASLGPTLPGLAEQTHTDLGNIGLLFTGRMLGYLLGSLITGPVYDRRSGNVIMAAALIGIAAMMALTPLVPLLWLLIGVMWLLGFGEGTLNVGGNTLLAWVHGDRTGPFMNGLHFFFGIGSFLAPVIIAQVMLRNGGIDWAYWSLALLIVPVAFWLLRLPAPQAQAPPESDSSANQKNWLVGLLVVFFFLHVGAMVGFSGWLFTYTVTLFPGSELAATYLTSAFWGALTVARLISIPIAARVNTGTLLLLALVGALTSLGVILAWSGSLTVLWIGTCGMGVSLATLYPLGVCLAQERITLTGRVGGWMFAGASAGGMVIPWLVGQMFESSGPQVTMWVSAVCLGLALVVVLAVNNPRAASGTRTEPA